MNGPPDILVAGAGPAGLALALQAHDHGAVVRVVERRPEAFRPSRPLILHSRTLEVLRPLGVTQARGGPRAGDRLPDQLVSSAGRSIRWHDLIARPGVHVLLDRDADLIGTLYPGRSVNIHRLSSSPGHGLIAVRPDGYVGFRSQIADVNQLAAWLARLRAGAWGNPEDQSERHSGR